MTKMPKAMVSADVCGTCAHYHQHYILTSKHGFVPVWYGHCAKTQVKSRNPDQTCEKWTEQED